MPEPSYENQGNHRSKMIHEVDRQARRKLRARRHAGRTAWFGLGTFGLIGWSVAGPALCGALFGLWLDRHHPGRHSWTLALLVAGLILGCLVAWHWIDRQHRSMIRQEEEEEEEKDHD